MIQLQQSTKFALTLWGMRVINFLHLCLIMYWMLFNIEVFWAIRVNLCSVSYLFYPDTYKPTIALVIPVLFNLCLWIPHKISYALIRGVLHIEKYKTLFFIIVFFTLGTISKMVGHGKAEECFICVFIAMIYWGYLKIMLKIVHQQKWKDYFHPNMDSAIVDAVIAKEWKRLKIWITVVMLMGIGCFVWINFILVEIVKVPDGFQVYSMNVEWFEPAQWRVTEKFVIVNPPSDLDKLRQLVDDYDKQYPMDIQAAMESVENAKLKDIYTEKEKSSSNIEYARTFYPENIDTPINWDGKYIDRDGPSYSSIAQIRWQEEDVKKTYICSLLEDGRTIKYIVYHQDGRTEEVEYETGSIIDKKSRYLDNWY